MMNTSGAVSSYSSVIAATQVSELKSALQLQEQALQMMQSANADRSVPADTVKGTQVDVTI